MCGIAGFYELSAAAHDRRQSLAHALRTIEHRGPDGEGIWIDDATPMALGHRRLAIVELTELGAQPMSSRDGRFILTFNGEIYNFLDLRRDLERTGPALRGGSDTEVLVELIARDGIEAALKASVGMFAFALWDRRDRTLSLARDRMGEKPLYFGCLAERPGSAFGFASEVRALRAHPGFARSVSAAATHSVLRRGYVADPLSIFEGISKLPPGHWIALSESAMATGDFPESRAYWTLESAIAGAQSAPVRDEREWIDELDAALGRAVAGQMRADVPLGAFLSGGIDSTTVVALMQERSSRPIRTFTIGFGGTLYDEAPFARALAKRLGTEHEELEATPEEALALAPGMARVFDEPFADSSQIPTYMVSKLARSRVTVSLSGDGGDELFGGYNRYVLGDKLWRAASSVPRPVRLALAAGMRLVSPPLAERASAMVAPMLPAKLRFASVAERWEKLAAALSTRTPNDLYQSFTSYWTEAETARAMGQSHGHTQVGGDVAFADLSFIAKMMARDSLSYLPGDILVKVDRAGMASSLESRMPMLDHRVVELAWRIPDALKVRAGQGKWILRQVLGRRVPLAEMDRPKTGFSVPLDQWLRGPLRDWAESTLSPEALKRHGVLDPAFVRAAWSEHLSGRRNRQKEIWSVLMLQGWLEENANGART